MYIEGKGGKVEGKKKGRERGEKRERMYDGRSESFATSYLN